MAPVPIPTLPDGQPVMDDDGTFVPQARTFASVFNSISKVYSYRYDEALRDSPANALAMRRNVHNMALLQERLAPTINSKWQINVPDTNDPRHREVQQKLTSLVRAIPRFARMKSYLMEAVWYGRYGCQPVWGNRSGIGTTIWKAINPDWSHEPVNGDKIQYQWDGTPVILIDSSEKARFQQRDPESIVATDRAGFGLRLYKPEYQDRFIIHTHIVNDADYFEGEMAGGARGVGLRSMIYWADWLRTEVFQWMLGFMEQVGLMDLMVFNYAEGNKAAKAQAEANAKAISGKLALAVPRGPNENYQAIEMVSANVAGIGVLRDLIDGYFDRGIERMIVGQSMSSGGGGAGGLEGDGRADFARDTKHQLLDYDAQNLDETLTLQLISRLQRWNMPGTEDIIATFKSCNPEADKARKFENGLKLVQAGIAVKVDELREAAGDFTKPTEGDETVGGEQKADPNPTQRPGGRAATRPEVGDLPSDLMQLDAGQAQWQSHTIESGPRKGQSAFRNPRTGELRDKPPAESAKGALGKAKEKAAGAVSKQIDKLPGGETIKKLGAGALKVFHAVEKPLFAAMHASGQLAKEAAFERGMSDAHIESLGRVLGVADFIGGYAGAAAGMAVGGIVGAKIGSFMPTVSLAYLAYSTARNPLATWRAAKRLTKAKVDNAKETVKKAASAVQLEDEQPAEGKMELASKLADGYEGLEDPDWYTALLMAAIGNGCDLASAIDRANEAIAANPECCEDDDPTPSPSGDAESASAA